MTVGQVFYHTYFQRGQKNLLHKINRKQKPAAAAKKVTGDDPAKGIKKRVAKVIGKSQTQDLTRYCIDSNTDEVKNNQVDE